MCVQKHLQSFVFCFNLNVVSDDARETDNGDIMFLGKLPLKKRMHII